MSRAFQYTFIPCSSVLAETPQVLYCWQILQCNVSGLKFHKFVGHSFFHQKIFFLGGGEWNNISKYSYVLFIGMTSSNYIGYNCCFIHAVPDVSEPKIQVNIDTPLPKPLLGLNPQASLEKSIDQAIFKRTPCTPLGQQLVQQYQASGNEEDQQQVKKKLIELRAPIQQLFATHKQHNLASSASQIVPSTTTIQTASGEYQLPSKLPRGEQLPSKLPQGEYQLPSKLPRGEYQLPSKLPQGEYQLPSKLPQGEYHIKEQSIFVSMNIMIVPLMQSSPLKECLMGMMPVSCNFSHTPKN